MTPKDNRIAELEKQVKDLYDSEWGEYYEPLNRIFREVKKALPDTKQGVSMPFRTPDIIAEHMIHSDAEVRDELERLLTQMIEEIEGKNDSGGM